MSISLGPNFQPRKRKIDSEEPEQEISEEDVSDIADAASIVLGVNKKRLKVRRSKVKDVARGLAEVAYSMGETNDPDQFAEQMTEDIYSALESISEENDEKSST